MNSRSKLKSVLLGSASHTHLLVETFKVEENSEGKKADLSEHRSARRFEKVVVRRPAAAAVLASNQEGEILLLSQYREAVDMENPILEIPAGRVDPGETLLAAASRELAEETGLAAASWDPIASIWPSPGYLSEEIHIFRATDLGPDTEGHRPNEAEEVELVWLPPTAALERTKDAKTLIALYWLLARSGS